MFLHLIVFVLLIILPAIVLYCFSGFSLLECFKGCVAEMSCFSTLSSLSLRESREVVIVLIKVDIWYWLKLFLNRKVQLCFHTYYSLMYSCYCGWALWDPCFNYPGNILCDYYYLGWVIYFTRHYLNPWSPAPLCRQVCLFLLLLWTARDFLLLQNRNKQHSKDWIFLHF